MIRWRAGYNRRVLPRQLDADRKSSLGIRSAAARVSRSLALESYRAVLRTGCSATKMGLSQAPKGNHLNWLFMREEIVSGSSIFASHVGLITDFLARFGYKRTMYRHKHTWGKDGRCTCGAQRCGVTVLNNAKEHRTGQCTGGARSGHLFCKKHLYIERFRAKPAKPEYDYPPAA